MFVTHVTVTAVTVIKDIRDYEILRYSRQTKRTEKNTIPLILLNNRTAPFFCISYFTSTLSHSWSLQKATIPSRSTDTSDADALAYLDKETLRSWNPAQESDKVA